MSLVVRRGYSSCQSLVIRSGYTGVQTSHTHTPLNARSPSEVLVRVHAAGLNQLDRSLARGYGAPVLEVLRGKPPTVVLGQEFSGVVVEIGDNVMDLRVGDEVYGAVDPWSRCGTCTTLLRVNANDVARKPISLSHSMAATLPFAIMTVWRSSIVASQRRRCKSALVFGGAGAIGRTCVSLLHHVLGIDAVSVGRKGYSGNGKFDLVVDASSNNGDPLPVQHLVAPGGMYVTYNGVWLTRVGEYGAIRGTLYAVQELLDNRTRLLTEQGSSYHWGIMRGGGSDVLHRLARSIETGELPVWVREESVNVVDGLDELAASWDVLSNRKTVVKLV
jgi:hypothetical protein